MLELRPNHEPALAILKEMEATPDSTVHVYTLLIIGGNSSAKLSQMYLINCNPSFSVFLVLAVLGWILSTLDASLTEAGAEQQGTLDSTWGDN